MSRHAHIVLAGLVVALLAAAPVRAGTFSWTAFSGDGDSGISAAKTYTHAANVRGGNVAINGVPFTGGDTSGPGWSLAGTTAVYDGSGAGNLTGSVAALVSDFRYGPNNAPASLTLTGLTPGQSYVTTFYNKSWGNPGTRVVGVSASDGGGAAFDENFTGNNNGNLLRYGFVAPAAGSITYTFANGVDTYHHYGFSNELAPASPASPFSTATFSNDADSGIAADKLYTHAVDAAGTASARAVNNVPFERAGAPSGGVSNGSNWTITGANNGWSGSAGNVSGSVAALISDFWYNGNPMTTTLKGLVPGRQYVATWYNRGFGGAGTRINTVAADDGAGGPTLDSIGFDANYSGDNNGNVLRYTYTAPASGQLRVSFTPQANQGTFHQYAFSNELLPAADALLTDSFNSAANIYPMYAANASAGQRQTGALDPVSWTGGGNNQIGNSGAPHPGALLMADAGWAGMIQNFNRSLSAGGMTIDFDLDPKWTGYSGADLSQWGAVSIGADRFANGWVNRGDTHFGILFRGNGDYHAFDGATTLASGPTGLGTIANTVQHVQLRLSDPTDGNPFDGVGQTNVDVYLNGSASPLYSYVKGGGGYANNFVSFQGLNFAQVDNLEIRSSGKPVPSGFTVAPLTGDADSGIHAGKAYTHALNFNATGNRTVNGAVFTGTGANVDNPATNNYATTNLASNYAGNTNPVTGGVNALLTEFLYNGESNETVTLKNLRPGQKYATTFYATSFGDPGTRPVSIQTSQGDQIAFDQNYTGGKNGNLLRYEFTAQSTSMTFTVTPLIANSMHQYALSNELVGYRALLTDNFYAPSNPDTMDVNFNLAARQGGELVATGGNITYTRSGNQQVGNTTGGIDGGNYLLSAFNGTTALDHNFNQADSQGGMLISFDMAPNSVGHGDTSVWTAISLGLSQADRNAFITAAVPHFGILFRSNGGIQAFDGSADVTGTPKNWTDLGLPVTNQLRHIEMLLSDAGDGNPFNGIGQTTIDVYADGLLVYSFTKPDGGYADNYINFSATHIGGIDNLLIAQQVPEPASLGLLALAATGLARYVRRRR